MRKNNLGFGTFAIFIALALIASISAVSYYVFKGDKPPANPVASHGGPVTDYVSLVDNLRAKSATVKLKSDQATSPYAKKELVGGYKIEVNGQAVGVFEYQNDNAVQTADDGVSVLWLEGTRVYFKNKIIVIKYGNDAKLTQLDRLLDSLLGQPVFP